MAVATWQKSTARRLVSILAVQEITNQMLCGLSRTVTPKAGVISALAGQHDRTRGAGTRSLTARGRGGRDRRTERGDHIRLAGKSGGPLDDGAVGAEHEHGGSAVNTQSPHQVKPLGRVDVEVGH